MARVGKMITWELSINLFTYGPIVLCSIAGCGTVIAKMITLSRVQILHQRESIQLFERLRTGKNREVLVEAQYGETATHELITAILPFQGSARSLLKEKAEEKLEELVDRLESGLDSLALIATLGPLLGLFGTIVGITLVFDTFAKTHGSAQPQDLAQGIGTALYTTLLGIIVGVLALVSHRILLKWTQKMERRLTCQVLTAVDLCAGDIKHVAQVS